MFWCAGSWNLRAEQLQRIRGAQSRLIRKMLRMTRDKDETMPELLVRSNRALKERPNVTDVKHESWDNKSVQLSLDWGGHIARLG